MKRPRLQLCAATRRGQRRMSRQAVMTVGHVLVIVAPQVRRDVNGAIGPRQWSRAGRVCRIGRRVTLERRRLFHPCQLLRQVCHRHLLRIPYGGIGRPRVVSSGARIAGKRWARAGGSTSGMSQHMYWNEHCLTWQCYGDGTRCSWDEAVARAHEVKLGREGEEYAALGEEVTPARSRNQRRRRKQRKRHVRGRRVFHVKTRRSARSIEGAMRMVHVVTRRRRRSYDDAVQKFHRNRKRRRRRRGVAESTRSIVIAAPHHLMFVLDLRVPRSRPVTMKMIERPVRLSAGGLRTKYGSKCRGLP